MHFFLSCLRHKYMQGQPGVLGQAKRDIQFNKESQTKTCWTHGESVQARLISPFGAKSTTMGSDPILAYHVPWPDWGSPISISFAVS